MSLLRRFEMMTKRAAPAPVQADKAAAGPGAQAGPSVFRRIEAPAQAQCEDLRPALDWIGGEAWGEKVETLVCIDTETTGISAGSHPFVTGLARVPVQGGSVDVEQFCIEGAAGEVKAMRALFEALAAPTIGLLSFNGASFDLPLLRRRALRLGLRLPPCLEPGAPHLDLLHPARRLWRGQFEDCRLVTLERERLGRRRRGDIPSALIPAVYEALVRAPENAHARREYDRVVEHNRLDIVSLPQLLQDMAQQLCAPQDASMALRAANHHAKLGARARVRECLAQHLWPQLDLPSAGAPNQCASPSLASELALIQGALLAARTAKQGGDSASVERWLQRAHERFPSDPSVCEALAKHLEHAARDPLAALRVARRAESPCAHRIARLERKAGVSGAATPGERVPGPKPTPDPGPQRKLITAAALGLGHGFMAQPATRPETQPKVHVPGVQPEPRAADRFTQRSLSSPHSGPTRLMAPC